MISDPNKLNIIIDLDNTILSSVSFRELKNMKNKKKNMRSKDMGDHYRVFLRPYVHEFLDYIFKHFNVTVWTAAEQDYAMFIVDEIILNPEEYDSDMVMKNRPERKLKMIFHRKNCDQSQEKYHKDSPKDLRYLYHFPGYHRCNTIIIDDNREVIGANPKQVIPAKYFDIKKEDAKHDSFLLEAIQELEKIRKEHQNGGCISHNH